MSETARTGAALNKATRPFLVEDESKTWRLLATTLAVIAGLSALTLFTPYWPLQIASGVATGLVLVRLFIFFHDYMHGAILQKSKLMSAIMSVVGFVFLTVKSVWKETHDYHHKHNSKLMGSSIGSYPLLTIGMYKRLPKSKRFL